MWDKYLQGVFLDKINPFNYNKLNDHKQTYSHTVEGRRCQNTLMKAISSTFISV